METYDFSLFCRVHMKDTAPKEMGSNKQRIRRRRNTPLCSYITVEKGLILWYNNSTKCLDYY